MPVKTLIEVFVVLQMGAAEAPERVRARFEVVAALPPRLLVVQMFSSDLAALQKFDGVAAVSSKLSELDVKPALSETERLFVAGWMARGVKAGTRPGEGKEWDAPEFTPPDGPRR